MEFGGGSDWIHPLYYCSTAVVPIRGTWDHMQPTAYRSSLTIRDLPLYLIGLIGLVTTAWADDLPPRVIGDGGAQWEGGGGGTVPALVKTSEEVVEETNTPGNVVDFDVAEYPNWLFPQQIDSTRSILIGLGSRERGGTVHTPTFTFERLAGDFPRMFDDEAETAFEMRADQPGGSAGGRGLLIQFDLGSVFSVNRIKFFPRNANPAYPAPLFPFEKDFIKDYEIYTNDGSAETFRSGVLDFTRLVRGEQNEEAVVDIRIEPQFIRHLRFKSLSDLDFEIAEFQVFSLGFVPQATYVSNVFEFPAPALLGNLRWVQEKIGDPRLSKVQIRTRTGFDRQPLEFTREGVQGTGRVRNVQVTDGVREEEIPIDAAWKKAEDLAGAPPLSQPVEFQELTVTTPQALVESVLDNPDVEGQEALLRYQQLPPEVRDLLALDQDDYFDLNKDERTGIGDDLTNWSAWSPPYSSERTVVEADLLSPEVGTALTSPDARRFFQFMVEFTSEAFDAATGLQALAFDVAVPSFAESLVGEIVPRDAALAAETEFTFAVLSQIGSGSGFDRLEIDTPLRTSAVGLVQVVGPDGSVRLEADFTLSDLETLPVDEESGISVAAISSNRLALSFPEKITEDNTLVKVQFRNSVLRFATRFGSQAFSGEDRIGQRVLPGNAADLGSDGIDDPDLVSIGSLKEGNLSVAVPISKDLLLNVAADPVVFTPNGDGANDGSVIGYDVTNIGRSTQVRIRIYDLSGRLVRELTDLRTSGRYRSRWDGRDGSQRLVPPGNYIYSVSIDAHDGTFERSGVVCVAY